MKFKYIVRECQAEGVRIYAVEEAIQIPKGIKNETNLRFERKVNKFLNKGKLQWK